MALEAVLWAKRFASILSPGVENSQTQNDLQNRFTADFPNRHKTICKIVLRQISRTDTKRFAKSFYGRPQNPLRIRKKAASASSPGIVNINPECKKFAPLSCLHSGSIFRTETFMRQVGEENSDGGLCCASPTPNEIRNLLQNTAFPFAMLFLVENFLNLYRSAVKLCIMERIHNIPCRALFHLEK
jgi:hypothetical protein